MGQYHPFFEGKQPEVIIHLKTLGNQELLDFWEETQFIEFMLEGDRHRDMNMPVEYERLILQELRIRNYFENIPSISILP